MTIYLGIDDTDNLESRGTGRLAREIAAELSKKYRVFGVTRHQLYVHPDIPFTSHNSCAVIHIDGSGRQDMDDIFEAAKGMMMSDFIQGSDPGIAVASDREITTSVVTFGLDAKRVIVTQERARKVASNAGIRLEGLGGTEGGVIGAMAGIGLASMKNDGRFLLKGKNRDVTGIQPVIKILDAGVDQVMTLEGNLITDGSVEIAKSLVPSYVQGKAVLYVECREGRLFALKRD